MPIRQIVCAFLLLCCFQPAAVAQLTIEITKGAAGALPIAVAPFAGSDAGVDLAAVVRADLKRSGRFAPLDASGRPPSSLTAIDYDRWRAVGADHVVLGDVTPNDEGYAVRFVLAEVFAGKPLLSLQYSAPRDPGKLRRLAHRIADRVYQSLTGERGAFATRIAYVSVNNGRYQLTVADADGYSPRAVLRSPQPLLSPAWSPDGRRLAYVTLEKRRAQIYAQDVFNGRRELLSSAPGINGAPSWSPDGQRLAVTLSRDGNPEVYVVELADKSLRRVTNNGAIDTEASWSPDGRSLVFTSDRSGSPQLYKVPAGGGRATRLTFSGSYNARAAFSPDGDKLALVHRRNGRFYIGLMDADGGPPRLISRGGLDESPSFAPNGRMVIYATDGGALATAAVAGGVTQRLRASRGDVREPSWSPYTQ